MVGITYSDITYSDITYSDITYSDITYSDITYSDITYSDIRYSDITHSVRDCNVSILCPCVRCVVLLCDDVYFVMVLYAMCDV